VPSFDRIRGRLPSLYQPEDNDTSLLSVWLRAVGAVLDAMQLEANQVLQAHWFRYADQAMYNSWFLRGRALSRPPKPYPQPGDADLRQFPYIDDLARLGALLPVSPWEQPPQLRDLVEDYRLRISRMVEVYRNGLGTLGTLRRMVEAQLPANQGAPPERRDRPFWIEEFAPLVKNVYPAPTRGEPAQMVGPLMRWTIDNDGLDSAAPAVYIQGVAAEAGKVDATVNPMVELYQAGAATPRVGLAYADTLAAGQTLRLRPSANSWLGTDSGVESAQALPPEGGAADLTAPGPWQPATGGPAGPVAAIYQSHDLALWVAAGGTLARFDGTSWSNALTSLPRIGALAEDGQNLLIGGDGGLLRMALYPSGPFAAVPDAAFAGRKVMAIFRAADGRLWFGTDAGAFFQDAGGTVQPAALQGVAVNAIAQDRSGVFYFGTALGLFQWQPGTDTWGWYEGKSFGEENPDWQPFFPAKQGAERNFPEAGQPFLPAVNCVLCDSGASVWVGTESGIARYTALADQALDLETVLEAFPDICPGRVFTIQEDARGLLWFGTDRGLFRYDGRDWWQAQSGAWVQLGRADTIYPAGAARGQWRFDRASAKWQRLDGSWIAFTDTPRSTAEAAVHAIAWTSGVAADLGQWDGAVFSSPAAIAAGKLVVHVKPNEQTIVKGGIPALPRLPRGSSVWRYLSMEPPNVVAPGALPWWSSEGRLFPPPPDLAAPGEGRYDVTAPPPESDFDHAVFAYNPAARVWFEWEPKRPLAVLVRLKKAAPDENLDPAIIDRVWQGIQQVRPAGVRVRLAVEEEIVRS
jgi:hypothetical protein